MGATAGRETVAPSRDLRASRNNGADRGTPAARRQTSARPRSHTTPPLPAGPRVSPRSVLRQDTGRKRDQSRGSQDPEINPVEPDVHLADARKQSVVVE